jgi:hypothetical protein
MPVYDSHKGSIGRLEIRSLRKSEPQNLRALAKDKIIKNYRKKITVKTGFRCRVSGFREGK